jgi:glycosyltransferase involved in cell wall biosynthesis
MKKKLLILSVPPPFGGGEIRAKLMADYFANYNDFVIIENSNKSKNKSNQGKLLISNIVINIGYIIKNVWTIIKIRPAVVYLSIPKNFIPLLKIVPVLIFAKVFGAKVIGELAGRNFYFLEQKGMPYKLGLNILKKFDSIRILGNTVNKTLADHGLTSSTVIDNGVEIPNHSDNKVKTLTGQKLRIGFVGALHKNKGIFVLIEIAKILTNEGVDFELSIAGEWENNEDKLKVEQYLKTHQLLQKVKFLGLIHNEDKWNFYKSIDVFLLPSYNEGQPLVLIEAMAFGIPVVCSGVGAIPDTIVSGYNGFIIDNFSASEYVMKIKELTDNKDIYKAISSNNLNTFEKRFQVEDYLQNIHNWINSNSKN